MIYQGSAKYPVTGIFIHCTATPSVWRPKDTSAQRVAAIKSMHTDPKPKGRGWRDIGYHWLIDRDGTILPGRPETQIGAHVEGHNRGTIGVSLFGGQTSRHRDPFGRNFTPEQERALIDVISDLCHRANIEWIKGHNQVDAGKACPGFWVPDWLAAKRIRL